MTSVWPALWPPWNRTTTSAPTDSQSTILPLPSPAHWAPTTTTLVNVDCSSDGENERSPGAAAKSRAGAPCGHRLDDQQARVKAACGVIMMQQKNALVTLARKKRVRRAKKPNGSLGLAVGIATFRARPIRPQGERHDPRRTPDAWWPFPARQLCCRDPA